MLSTRRCAPENFSLGVIQLQLIGCHPSRNLIDTDGHFFAEVGRICGSAKPVDLSVVRVGMRNQLVVLLLLYQLQQVSVYRRNRIGLRTDPCGTPYRTADGVERGRQIK